MTTYKNLDDYIDNFPQEVQILLQQMRKTIHEAIPEAEETISYGIPTFKLAGKNVVHFGGFKQHIGFFPTGEGIEVFTKDLERYKPSKGTIQFPFTQPIPFDLVTKITKYRAKKILSEK